jgi:hypothetical protein
VPASFENFRNVIVCEDVREEVGGKHSLMGVFSGDIIVSSFPATIQIAGFFQYIPPANESGDVDLQVTLIQGENVLVRGKMRGQYNEGQLITFLLPRAFATFEKEGPFRIRIKVGDEEQDILTKKVSQGLVTTAPIASPPPASQSQPGSQPTGS